MTWQQLSGQNKILKVDSSPVKLKNTFKNLTMDQIPQRSSLPLAEGTKQVAKKQTGQKGGTLTTVCTKQGQVKTKKAAQSAKWDEEEWMLVPLQDYQLVPIFEEKQSRINLPHSASRLFCFSSLWTEDE